MFYELWDLDSGNLISDFDTESEALRIVRDLLEVNTPDFADGLSLGRTDDDGTFAIVAQGAALVARARSDAAPQAARP